MSILHIIAAAAAAFAAVSPANAAEFRTFDRAGFAAAQAEGRPVLVDVAAWWCPVCHSQESTIKKAVVAKDYARLVVFKLDYDKQKPEWRSFGVDKQGTLIAFKGRQEVARLRFQTDKAEIAGLLAATIR